MAMETACGGSDLPWWHKILTHRDSLGRHLDVLGEQHWGLEVGGLQIGKFKSIDD
jgi:hypothetical protein